MIKRICNRLIREIKSFFLSRKIDEGGGRISILSVGLSMTIKKEEGAKLIIKGNLRVNSHCGGLAPVYIHIGKNATLSINGDFIIGQGVRIELFSNSCLTFGGKEKESDSGITSDTLIMAYKKIDIGKDFLCAWNIFISDSDWHSIKGQNHQEDLIIGNHVWVANSCSILKGSKIGNNNIVASHSKVIKGLYPDDCLIAGSPAKVVRDNINWSRDI